MTVEPTTDQARPRRDVLCGLVVALLAPGALTAACGGSGSGGGGGSTPTGGGGTGGGGAGGQALAAVADVPEGGGLVVDKPGGGKLLLVRPDADTVKAFNAACPHQGTTVDPPQGGTITCPNHGSQFDGATGAVKKGPAETDLAEVQVKVEGGSVVLA
ncbi:MAG TPA: Rieske (2Fe-2S) protein [Actinophytocola sp.]|uniref:Rieske (2Fe-2S) protein n=1 Tax=Actinophytocola sp. TaxID=1872138 RepID=UPI002DDCEE02|nr:Rieske (2Fe-2S) protein [Actinophytocola sp.]HEV2780818.1 Rieske (2Fe-2S) protein [Actinophytocola sp.]